MTKVLIDRELLERLEHVTRNLVPHLQCHADLVEALAAPRQPEGEAVEVRGLQWLDTGHYRKKPPQFGYNPHDWNPLMTVAQHQRILADVCQQRDKLAGLLRDARELIDHGDFREGHCMCGSSVDDHGVGDGHSPVDAGEYYAGQPIERIKTALSEPTP